MVSPMFTCCVWVCMFALLTGCSLAAPLQKKDTKIAITFNGDQELEEKDVQGSAGRTKRDLFSELSALDGDLDLNDGDHVTRHQAGRSRRSATWMLHATIKLCTKYQSLCKQIEVMEGDTRVSIRLEAE